MFIPIWLIILLVILFVVFKLDKDTRDLLVDFIIFWGVLGVVAILCCVLLYFSFFMFKSAYDELGGFEPFVNLVLVIVTLFAIQKLFARLLAFFKKPELKKPEPEKVDDSKPEKIDANKSDPEPGSLAYGWQMLMELEKDIKTDDKDEAS